jgi:hypothetical protein
MGGGCSPDRRVVRLGNASPVNDVIVNDCVNPSRINASLAIYRRHGCGGARLLAGAVFVQAGNRLGGRRLTPCWTPVAVHPYVRNPQHIRRFVAAFGDSLHIIRGVAGRDPAGTITFDRPGLAVVGYSSRHTATSLPASRFEAYLREEGLDHVIESRERRGETLAPGREKFSRSAKSILQVGGLGLEGYDRRLGFPFEIVPERNPYELAQGDSLPVRLYFRGRPLGGALVTAYQTKSSQVEATGRSDANGLVLLAIDRPGEWMIKSVHMVSVEGDPAADWESIWATLTFERTLRADSALR